MMPARPKNVPDDREACSAADAPKARRCLKCGTDFRSEWSGERICPCCKKRSEWRSGALPWSS